MHVIIVSANAETLDGLQDYLRSVGVPCRTTRDIDDLVAADPKTPTSAVIFPDDFSRDDVPQILGRLRHTHPKLRALLVTRERSRFDEVAQPHAKGGALVVLPRPSFGWEILDALLAHAEDLTTV